MTYATRPEIRPSTSTLLSQRGTRAPIIGANLILQEAPSELHQVPWQHDIVT